MVIKIANHAVDVAIVVGFDPESMYTIPISASDREENSPLGIEADNQADRQKIQEREYRNDAVRKGIDGRKCRAGTRGNDYKKAENHLILFR